MKRPVGVPRGSSIQQSGHNGNIVKSMRQRQAVLPFDPPGLQGAAVDAATITKSAKGFGKVVVRREATWITAGHLAGHVQQTRMDIAAAGVVVDSDNWHSLALGAWKSARGLVKGHRHVHGVEWRLGSVFIGWLRYWSVCATAPAAAAMLDMDGARRRRSWRCGLMVPIGPNAGSETTGGRAAQ